MSNIDTTVPDETIQAVTARLSAATEKPWLIRGDDIEAILAEVRRLTDANTRLTDLVRHQRGPLHTEDLITDAEYAALAGLTGSPARLEGYDALRGELERTRRALNVATGERAEAQAALQSARVDGARVMRDHILDFLHRRLRYADLTVSGTLSAHIRAIDPAAVVGSPEPALAECPGCEGSGTVPAAVVGSGS